MDFLVNKPGRDNGILLNSGPQKELWFSPLFFSFQRNGQSCSIKGIFTDSGTDYGGKKNGNFYPRIVETPVLG